MDSNAIRTQQKVLNLLLQCMHIVISKQVLLCRSVELCISMVFLSIAMCLLITDFAQKKKPIVPERLIIIALKDDFAVNIAIGIAFLLLSTYANKV